MTALDGVRSQPPAAGSVAVQQAQDLNRLLALAHRLGLATPSGADHSQLASGNGAVDWQLQITLSGLPMALDAFVAALPQELPRARIDRIARPAESAVPPASAARAATATSATSAELTLTLGYGTRRP